MRIRLVLWTLALACPAILTGCHVTPGGNHNLPPAERLMHPGPGVGGPGPGVMMPHGGVMQASYAGGGGGGMMAGGGAGCMPGGGGGAVMPGGTAQVLFGKPDSMQVQWDVSGVGSFDSQTLITPGRQNFQQGGLYRLKVTGIPGREGVELYPTVAIYPASARSAAYLAHNAIPVQFTDQDLDQVLAGNFVTKAVYIPDPEFQELAVGVDTLVSSPVDPGLDPVVEADRRGTLLAVIRLGNKDLETPGSDVTAGGIIQASYNGAAGAGVQPAVYRPAANPAASRAAAVPNAQRLVQPTSFTVDGGTVYNDPGAYIGSEGCDAGGCDSAFAGCGSGVGGACGSGTFDPGPGGMPPGLAGGGQYGMTMSGTPIGLPGPPHIPLGAPAGLQKHVVRNWTHMKIPDPTSKVRINVKQRPGLSYPTPASRAWVTEDTIHPHVRFSQRHFGTPPGPHGGIEGAGGLVGGLKQVVGSVFHPAGGGAACTTCQ